MAIEFNEEKFKELVLYIADKTKDDVSFDENKLKTALFICDFAAFENLGEPITGETYIKDNRNGSLVSPLHW